MKKSKLIACAVGLVVIAGGSVATASSALARPAPASSVASQIHITAHGISYPKSAIGDYAQIWVAPKTCQAGDRYIARCYTPAETLATQFPLNAGNYPFVGIGLACGLVVRIDVTTTPETQTTLGASGPRNLVTWPGDMLASPRC